MSVHCVPCVCAALLTPIAGYWAPEVMAERPFEGPETDCWSLGVTLYGMAIGRLPFNRESATYHDDVMQVRDRGVATSFLGTIISN